MRLAARSMSSFRSPDPGRERDEDQHGPGHALVRVLEQDVEEHGQEDEECPIQQVGNHGHADKSGVRDHIRGGGCRVAGNIHFGIYNSFGKATEDADEQIEDAGDSRKTFW